jgi:serine/threonine protein phosphatase PrpC
VNEGVTRSDGGAANLAGGGLRISYYSARGPRARNEDWIGGYVPGDPYWRAAKGGCFVVADGFGGHRSGDVASRLACETVLADYYRAPDTDMTAALGASLLSANRVVSDTARWTPELRGMASTVVAASVRVPGPEKRTAEAAIAHMGDSRAYQVHGNSAQALTRDHSWVQELLDARVISPEDARRHHYRNVVTRYAGMGVHARVDVRRVWLQPGDALLLCSDGVSDRVPARELGPLVDGASSRDPALAVIHRATALGAHDNLSAMIIRYCPWDLGARRSPRGPAAETHSGVEDLLPALIFGAAMAIGAILMACLLAALAA